MRRRRGRKRVRGGKGVGGGGRRGDGVSGVGVERGLGESLEVARVREGKVGVTEE